MIGECKDAGGTIDADDVDNLRQVAEAFPKHRFDVFILLAKLAPFTTHEIALAGALNTKPWQRRVILLTAREHIICSSALTPNWASTCEP